MGDHNVSTHPTGEPIPESRHDSLSYVYVLAFASGTVKVGKADDPRKRLSHHGRHAEIHGDRIEKHWVSTPHANPYRSEGYLIAFCESKGKSISGREWFRGVTFDQVVQFAETISYPLPNPAVETLNQSGVLPVQEWLVREHEKARWENNCHEAFGMSLDEVMAIWEASEAEPATWSELKELARRRRERARLAEAQDLRWVGECRFA